MMVFVTGGARSGKSWFAEQLALESGRDVVYIATAQPGDSEMRARIAQHRQRRPAGWTTIEAAVDLPQAIGRALTGSGTVLVDCLTIYLSNLLLAAGTEIDPAGRAGAVDKAIDQIIDISLKEKDAYLILISNEVGMGIVPEKVLGRFFRDVAGRANQRLAAVADEVYLCVSGIPVLIKEGTASRRRAWPDAAGRGQTTNWGTPAGLPLNSKNRT